MNRPSDSANSARWRRGIGSTSTGRAAGLRVAPLARRMPMQGLAQETRLSVGEPGERAHADAVDRVPGGAGIDAHLQGRAAEPVEQEPPERLEALIAGDAEAHQQLEFAFRLEIGGAGAAGG